MPTPSITAASLLHSTSRVRYSIFKGIFYKKNESIRTYSIKTNTISKNAKDTISKDSVITESTNINPWVVSGFSDAESCFSILIRKSLTHKLNWAITGRFRIELHVRDLELLKSLQSFFNGIGQVGPISTRKLVYFEVTKLNDLVNIIISHFDKYPLQSVKSVDYLLWKQCIHLMATKEHLTQSGLEKIISIKAALNLGNSELLRVTFPDVQPIERPSYIITEESLNPYWVSGFSEGDSSFIVTIPSNRTNEVNLAFGIHLNEREKPLLTKMQSFFQGIGFIYDNSYDNSCYYKITKKTELNDTIKPHFNSYELVGNKKPTF